MFGVSLLLLLFPVGGVGLCQAIAYPLNCMLGKSLRYQILFCTRETSRKVGLCIELFILDGRTLCRAVLNSTIKEGK